MTPRVARSVADFRARLAVTELESRDVPDGTPTVSIAAGADGSEDGARLLRRQPVRTVRV